MALSARALALFLVCVSAADVSASGESVNVTVTTTSVHVSWQKEGQWKGVNSFHVDLKMNGYSFCDKNVLCLFSTSCAFNSEAQCGKIAPCADVFVTVTGNNFTAQVDVMTDAVKIQNCPPQGCTEVDINWEYKPVCPDVDHLYLTLGDVFNTTTDLSVTGVTIKELDLNTKYRTCLHAFDVDDTLLARHCTNCRSQPEVVDKLSVTNVTDTTAVIDWEPPICPTADEIEYNVSYSKSGNKRSYITTDSKFQWTELKPAQNHNLCVTVLHNGITSADPACVDAFTLPESLGRIVVRVYEESSLFITWEGGFFTPNLKYRVSWGDDLTHFDYTEYKSYTIDGYNETVGPNEVCVEGETKLPTGLRSIATCQESPFPNFIPAKPDHTDMIIGVSVSAGLALLLSLMLVVKAMKEPRSKKL
ncbi:uncharacterized protein LOC123498655 isoform X5 [Portunus trituberculatus]|uniref:uncharacterized protein LOC123498655 isoform X5 n=1 Tax=Portunus trituberculatus TaxID=210409 RepID=UPI001E1CC3A8|nr:uncharacterized protein LOC123498655 isoform X5 [Portunus trituberculatus]